MGEEEAEALTLQLRAARQADDAKEKSQVPSAKSQGMTGTKRKGGRLVLNSSESRRRS